jgi:hypothetical protein
MLGGFWGASRFSPQDGQRHSSRIALDADSAKGCDVGLHGGHAVVYA